MEILTPVKMENRRVYYYLYYEVAKLRHQLFTCENLPQWKKCDVEGRSSIRFVAFLCRGNVGGSVMSADNSKAEFHSLRKLSEDLRRS